MKLQPASTPSMLSDERPDEARKGWQGRWLVYIRILCIVLVIYTLGFFGTGLMLAFAHYRSICSGLTCVLPIPETLVH
jgi:hypothetical protein